MLAETHAHPASGGRRRSTIVHGNAEQVLELGLSSARTGLEQLMHRSEVRILEAPRGLTTASTLRHLEPGHHFQRAPSIPSHFQVFISCGTHATNWVAETLREMRN